MVGAGIAAGTEAGGADSPTADETNAHETSATRKPAARERIKRQPLQRKERDYSRERKPRCASGHGGGRRLVVTGVGIVELGNGHAAAEEVPIAICIVDARDRRPVFA